MSWFPFTSFFLHVFRSLAPGQSPEPRAVGSAMRAPYRAGDTHISSLVGTGAGRWGGGGAWPPLACPSGGERAVQGIKRTGDSRPMQL